MQYSAGVACVWNGSACARERSDQVPASGTHILRRVVGRSADSYLQGFGTLLMEEAKRIAREEHGSIKLAVISGEHGHCDDYKIS